MRRRRTWIAAGLAVLLAFAWGVADSIRPYVTLDRAAVESTPGLGPLDTRTEFPLRRRGDEVCMRPIVISPGAKIARLRLTAKDPGPRLEVAARAPGYLSVTEVDGYGIGSDQSVDVAMTPSDDDLVGELCVKHIDRRGSAALVGAQDVRSQVPPDTYRNGKLVPGDDLELAFLESTATPLIDRPGDLVDRAHTVTGGLVPQWTLWVLLVLVALGAPAAIAVGFALSVRDRPPTAPPPGDR